jgi:hypothetical protein
VGGDQFWPPAEPAPPEPLAKEWRQWNGIASIQPPQRVLAGANLKPFWRQFHRDEAKSEQEDFDPRISDLIMNPASAG